MQCEVSTTQARPIGSWVLSGHGSLGHSLVMPKWLVEYQAKFEVR